MHLATALWVFLSLPYLFIGDVSELSVFLLDASTNGLLDKVIVSSGKLKYPPWHFLKCCNKYYPIGVTVEAQPFR